jgi:hypothetical protein
MIDQERGIPNSISSKFIDEACYWLFVPTDLFKYEQSQYWTVALCLAFFKLSAW